mmetsp:Transcript_40711/g.97671  ORF Transcript_40711/g.97671 Transcript_40711/m.97671 type:complete len:215 (-) Transcript_40711:319-963(-)
MLISMTLCLLAEVPASPRFRRCFRRLSEGRSCASRFIPTTPLLTVLRFKEQFWAGQPRLALISALWVLLAKISCWLTLPRCPSVSKSMAGSCPPSSSAILQCRASRRSRTPQLRIFRRRLTSKSLKESEPALMAITCSERLPSPASRGPRRVNRKSRYASNWMQVESCESTHGTRSQERGPTSRWTTPPRAWTRRISIDFSRKRKPTRKRMLCC